MQNTRGRAGHNTRARGRGVDAGRGNGSGGVRGRSRDQEHSNPKRLRVAEASKGLRHSRSKLRESDGPPAAKLTHMSSGDISSQVKNDLPNVLQQPSQDDHPGVKRRSQHHSNPKRLKITEKSRGRPRKSKLRASDEAPAAKRARETSGDIASQLPIFPQIPSPDVHSNAASSLYVCTVSDGNHSRLASSSQSHVHNTTRAGRGKQVLANGDLSLKRGREDGDLQFNNLCHLPVSSSKPSIVTSLPQSTRPVRPFPRKVSTIRISPRHGQQISAAEPSMRVLNREDVDCPVKDVSRDVSLTHFQTVLAPLENWAEIQDNDEDGVVDVEEFANEFDAHSANDAPAPVSSYGEAIEGSAPTIQPQRPPLPSTPPIWAQVCAILCEHTKALN